RPIFKGLGTAGDAFGLSLSQTPDASQFFLALEVSRDLGPDLLASPVAVLPGTHEVMVEWWGASEPGGRDGGGRLWVDGTLAASVTEVGNWSKRVEAVRLGAVESDELSVSGAYSLDSFESWRGWNGRTYRQVDGFESGALSRWPEVSVDGAGSVSASPAAALEGAFGLAVEIQSADLHDRVGTSWSEADRKLSVELRFDPNALAIPPGNFTLLQVYGPNGSPISLRIRMGAPGYHLLMVAEQDGLPFANSAWLVVPDAPQTLTLTWQAASLPGLADGSARLFLGSSLLGELTGLDNAAQLAKGLRLGAVFSLDPGTAGVTYFDNVQVWK
ncbi:MAG: hypothetical protein KDD47_24705, partial [Acidobacteria bacterium]|nr:hypothetical protein [Acidobacteriota bacterium]